MSDGTTQTAAKVVWFEVPAEDAERAKAFYGPLFGWSFEQFGDMAYFTSNEAGGAINGMTSDGGILTYFGTTDIDASLARVRELGGEAGDKQEIPEVGFAASCKDGEGNAFGLFQATASA